MANSAGAYKGTFGRWGRKLTMLYGECESIRRTMGLLNEQMSGGIATAHERPEPHASLYHVKFTLPKKQLKNASVCAAGVTPKSAVSLFSQGLLEQGQAETLGSVGTIIELGVKGDGCTHNEEFLNIDTKFI